MENGRYDIKTILRQGIIVAAVDNRLSRAADAFWYCAALTAARAFNDFFFKVYLFSFYNDVKYDIINCMKKIAVIGGGASGVFAAVAAAEKPEATVTVFEKNDRLMKKLLRTGNGRCNFTTTMRGEALCQAYNNPDIASAVLNRFTPDDTIARFEKLGLLSQTVGDGVYPLSMQANSVVNVLLIALKKRNVEVVTGCAVHSIEKNGQGYLVCGRQFDRVIVAVGTAAGCGTYDTLAFLPSEIERRAFTPALAALACDRSYTKGLGGIRMQVQAQLVRCGESVLCDRGEILFKDGFLSGIVLFGLSARFEYGDCVRLNFLPDQSESDIRSMLKQRRRDFADEASAQTFTGIFAKNLGALLIERAGIECRNVGEISDVEIEKLCCLIRQYDVPINRTDTMECAQVARGGILTNQLSCNLEHIKYKNLYFCGEAIDIDGRCGGFNLQWAWSSAMIAAGCANPKTEKNA